MPSQPELKYSRALPGDILVVDDNPANLLAIEAALGDLAGRVVRAHSGPTALRCLLGQEFALILLDVQMPSMDGFQTARLIRQRARSQHTPIIFFTAYMRDDRDIRQAYELGAVDFLFKPIVPEVLRAKASVFVDLQRRAAEIAQQEKLLRKHERREHELELEEQRRRLEEEALRQRMTDQEKLNAELQTKASELTATVRKLESAERELSRTNARLARADRRKDEFLAVLAHELRNPLAPLVTSLDLLKTCGPGTDKKRLDRTVAAMARQVTHLRRLVDDLLDVSRITSDKLDLRRAPLDLREVVEHAVATSRPELELRNQHLTLSLPDSPVCVEGDFVRLAQVIANLLNNAARYSNEGSSISLACLTNGSAALVHVTDAGQGISPELLPRVFDIFVQQQRGGGGLGIGLTLVKRLVEMHKGKVLVHSDGKNKGTRFTIELPLSTARAQHFPPKTPLPAPLEPLRVVIIDDNQDIRETAGELLQSWGHEVATASTGGTGVELIVRQRPDVAIVDIGLPDIDGCAVARKVRRIFNNGRPGGLRLVAMTGFGSDDDRQRAAAAGFDAVLIKPAAADQLAGALRSSEQPDDSGTPTGLNTA